MMAGQQEEKEMKNGKTLTLVKMGCDFFNGDRINSADNYTEIEIVDR